jgi:hypothetical protein
LTVGRTPPPRWLVVRGPVPAAEAAGDAGTRPLSVRATTVLASVGCLVAVARPGGGVDVHVNAGTDCEREGGVVAGHGGGGNHRGWRRQGVTW